MADDVPPRHDLGPSPTEATPQTEEDAAVRPPRRRRSAYATRDLTKGSIPRNLWFLGWPQIAEGFLSVIDHVADLVWAGRLGFQAIAGLGVAQTYIMVVMTARMGLDAGMRSMVARAVGAGNVDYANHLLRQSLAVTSVYGLLMIVVGLVLTEPLLRILGLSDSLVDQAAPYMRLQFVAMALHSYQGMAAGALQAAGEPMTPLRAATITRVSHLALSPLFIFGWLWFPSLGLAGAAVARLLAESLGMSWNFYALFRGTSRLQLTLRGFYLDFPLIWRLLRVGAPASVTNMQRGVSQLIVVAIVAPFGETALAAFALTRRVENVATQSSRGLGRAAGALAGQNLGAGKPERAKSAVRWALVYVGAASLILTAVFLTFPENLVSFFNSDSEFLSKATKWITILAIGTFSMSMTQVFTQAFNTTGDTMAPMVVTLSTMWAVEIPLAFALSNFTTLGEFGVPWAIVAGMTLRMVIFGLYFTRDRWLRTGVM